MSLVYSDINRNTCGGSSFLFTVGMIYESSLKVSLLCGDIDRETYGGSTSYGLMISTPNKMGEGVVLPKFNFSSLPRHIDASTY